MTDDDKTVPYTPENMARTEAAINNIQSTPASDNARELADLTAAENAEQEWAATPEEWSSPVADEAAARAEEAEWSGATTGTTGTTGTPTDPSDQTTDSQWGPESNEQWQPAFNDIDSTPASDLARDMAAENAETEWAATPEEWGNPAGEAALESGFDY